MPRRQAPGAFTASGRRGRQHVAGSNQTAVDGGDKRGGVGEGDGHQSSLGRVDDGRTDHPAARGARSKRSPWDSDTAKVPMSMTERPTNGRATDARINLTARQSCSAGVEQAG